MCLFDVVVTGCDSSNCNTILRITCRSRTVREGKARYEAHLNVNVNVRY